MFKTELLLIRAAPLVLPEVRSYISVELYSEEVYEPSLKKSRWQKHSGRGPTDLWFHKRGCLTAMSMTVMPVCMSVCKTGL